MRRCTGVSVTYSPPHGATPRSTRQTGSQRKLGGNARSFLSRYTSLASSLKMNTSTQRINTANSVTC